MLTARSVIDLELEGDDETSGCPVGSQRAPETKVHNLQGPPFKNENVAPARRGPMASAIAETASATAEKSYAEKAIGAENDSLAHEHVRLKELAQLAFVNVRDAEVKARDTESTLYASALKQKRRYFLQFARILDELDGAVKIPEVIPRAWGLNIYRAIDADPEKAEALAKALWAMLERDGIVETRLLPETLGEPKQQRQRPIVTTVSRTSLSFDRPEGEARVTAQDGRVELRLNKDFSVISKAKLQTGI